MGGGGGRERGGLKGPLESAAAGMRGLLMTLRKAKGRCSGRVRKKKVSKFWIFFFWSLEDVGEIAAAELDAPI